MTTVRLLDLVVLVVLAASLVLLMPRTWSMWRIYAGIRHRRLQDGSSFAPPAPPAVAVLAERLEQVGFQRIGERTLVSSPEDAVAAHRRLLSEAASTHGPALSNRSMEDLLLRDATYRERHGGATLRRRMYLSVMISGLAILAAASALVRLVVMD